MKQYQLDTHFSIDGLAMQDAPIPTPGANEVLIKVKALSLNFRDYNIVRGGYPDKLTLPFVPVSDGAGEVVAVGAAVQNFKPKDRVMTHFLPKWRDGTPAAAMLAQTLGAPLPGLLAEYAVLPSEALAILPDYLSFTEAATLPVAALTAWHAVVAIGRITAGQTVVVQGTGGVAIFALQFAKMHGARVIVTSSSDEKLKRAKELGADALINYKTTPEWHKEVLKLTNGYGADIVLDVAGTTLNQSLAAVRVGGQVSAIGLLQGHEPKVNIVPLLQHKKSIVGITVGSYAMLQDMLIAMETHQLHPIIGATFQFADTKQAFQQLADGDTFGKIAITI